MSMSMPLSNLNLELSFPQSVGVYGKYAEAQKAVDFLADEKFPVENLAIVGTELKLVERVTGRKNWRTVLLGSLNTGITTGLLVGILIGLFSPQSNIWAMMLVALGVSIVLNLVFAAIGYSLSGGKRDFRSITQTVPTKYEILCEHKVAGQAREMLLRMPGARASAFE